MTVAPAYDQKRGIETLRVAGFANPQEMDFHAQRPYYPLISLDRHHTMNTLIVACPSCKAKNKMAASKQHRGPRCGKCPITGLLELRDRFGVISRLDYYNEEELVQIIMRAAVILNVQVDMAGASEIARRARGTPRVANRLLKRVRDYAQVRRNGVIDISVASEALEFFEVDPMGLDEIDRRLLRVIMEKFGGGPVGLDTVAAAVGEEAATVEDVYEPFLMQRGLLARTPRGRVATASAYRHLGLAYPVNREEQGALPL